MIIMLACGKTWYLKTLYLMFQNGTLCELLYPQYEVYKGYIVFAFSVIMFVCLSVCLFVCKLFFSSKISQQLLGLGF